MVLNRNKLEFSFHKTDENTSDYTAFRTLSAKFKIKFFALHQADVAVKSFSLGGYRLIACETGGAMFGLAEVKFLIRV